MPIYFVLHYGALAFTGNSSSRNQNAFIGYSDNYETTAMRNRE